MKKHQSIPVFIPHLGCPNGCVFCNQRTISGHGSYDFASVKGEIEAALATVNHDVPVQIAFFGGSFTGIDKEEMERLLALAEGYVREGRVDSIRLSTRPDYISEEILDILGKYTVKTVELGIQSVSETVLRASKRGHTRADTENACNLIKSRGLSLIGQMMLGLPASTLADEVETAKVIADLGADGARIYPTVVFRNTALAEMMHRGEYTPLSNEEAITRGAAVLAVFTERGIPVIRMGLQSGESLSDGSETVSDYDPAIGERIKSRLMGDRMAMALEKEQAAGRFATFAVGRECLSTAIGQRGETRERLLRRFSLQGIRFVPSEGLSFPDFSVQITDGKPS